MHRISPQTHPAKAPQLPDTRDQPTGIGMLVISYFRSPLTHVYAVDAAHVL